MTYDLDRDPIALLTTGNPKTAKGEGYLTAILHFAPHKLAGFNVCGHASPQCIEACLNTAGRGGIDLDADGLNMIQAARIRRTRYFKRDQHAFMRQLVHEVAAHEARAIRHGLKPAVRLNGTSDLPWENVRCGGHRNIMGMFPGIVFYDYTKLPARLRRNVAAIPNYSLTFSLSEVNEQHARDALASGINVAVVFATRKNHALPATYFGAAVIDGDRADLRFTDPTGVIVGLRAKGRARGTTNGFIRATN